MLFRSWCPKTKWQFRFLFSQRVIRLSRDNSSSGFSLKLFMWCTVKFSSDPQIAQFGFDSRCKFLILRHFELLGANMNDLCCETKNLKFAAKSINRISRNKKTIVEPSGPAPLSSHHLL